LARGRTASFQARRGAVGKRRQAAAVTIAWRPVDQMSRRGGPRPTTETNQTSAQALVSARSTPRCGSPSSTASGRKSVSRRSAMSEVAFEPRWDSTSIRSRVSISALISRGAPGEDIAGSSGRAMSMLSSGSRDASAVCRMSRRRRLASTVSFEVGTSWIRTGLSPAPRGVLKDAPPAETLRSSWRADPPGDVMQTPRNGHPLSPGRTVRGPLVVRSTHAS